MEVLHQSLEDVFAAWVGALGIDELGVLGDVLNGQVFEMRQLGEVVGFGQRVALAGRVLCGHGGVVVR